MREIFPIIHPSINREGLSPSNVKDIDIVAAAVRSKKEREGEKTRNLSAKKQSREREAERGPRGWAGKLSQVRPGEVREAAIASAYQSVFVIDTRPSSWQDDGPSEGDREPGDEARRRGLARETEGRDRKILP